LEDRRSPAANDPNVLALLPAPSDVALIAINDAGDPLGVAWWHMHDPPLLTDADGSPLPELAMAVIDGARGKGVGTALVEALASEAADRFRALTLNVHLGNRAARLYMRTGFRVVAKGRGWFGVAMSRGLGIG